MIFNSLVFLIYFILFFFLYWFVFNKGVKYQNLFLLFGSYFFYAWADWRFLSFLIGVSTINFLLGIYIEKETRYKRLFLYIGLIQGIGGLAFFKYFNFFITSFNDLFQSLNVNLHLQILNIAIPLGISFFTFRTIGYILDVEKGKIKATKDWLVFFNYVSFFPSLLSGPIDKAKLFVPQLERKREFDYNQATDGVRQIVWGLFKKVVIADNCAIITTQTFDNYQILPGSNLLFAAFLFTIQIYADFSGYSDMAIGFSRLIGFNITKNFDFPFFSQNIAEFWRKWHISLTSWMTEYVFIPLNIAFRDYNNFGLILAVLINFIVIGIWHGANWTYLLFGILHGCYFIPLILRGKMHKQEKTAKSGLIEFINMFGTFTLVMLTFILFRSDNLDQAYHYYFRLCSFSIFSLPALPTGRLNGLITLFFIVVMFIAEWFQREKNHALQTDREDNNQVLYAVLYYTIILAIILFGSTVEDQFIYFKF